MSNLYILNIINQSGEEADYSIDCVYEDIPPVTIRDRDNWMTILNLSQHYIPITVSVLPQGDSPSVDFVLAKNGKGVRGDIVHSPGNKLTVGIGNDIGTPL
ncbi:hypothetical protein FACUT_12741 [Fusarium acutatum]|uniref:Uncharacterized protein n=1 Tax=Fusarium acutatum TaxID=78861 RepID=A0A8H4JAQ4_9HYPO|nr:hypothetical protein FACUT_12741 [Fusarium acutatum]